MAAVAALLVAAPRPVAAVVVVQEVTFMTFNYCGIANHCGNNGAYSGPNGPSARLRHSPEHR